MDRRFSLGQLFWIILVIILTLIIADWASAANRVALVVGNSDYEHDGKLPNAVNDAEDMAALLRGLKGEDGKDLFDAVRLETNRKRSELMEDLAALAAEGEKGGLVMFFYAGHGLVIDGENYLQPVDAQLVPGEAGKKLSKVRCVKVRDALGLLEGGADGGLTLALLDCCRNNPYEVKRTGGANRALRKMGSGEIPDGQLVVFATSKEDVADDGAGRNSPFTAALKRHIPTPGVEALTLMRRVVGDVKEETFAVQRPEITFSYENEFVLVPGDARPGDPPVVKESFGGGRAGELWDQGTLGSRMRWCPPGIFLMGSPIGEVGRSEDEVQRGVRISRGFYMAEVEVTEGEWKAIMERTQESQVDLLMADDSEYRFYELPEAMTLLAFHKKHWNYTEELFKSFAGGGRYPVNCITLYEAKDYCKRLTKLDRESGKIPQNWEYRLPTEAEWEYACRAGSDKATYAGDLTLTGKYNSPELDGIAWHGGNSSDGYPKGKGYDTSRWTEKHYPGGNAGPRETGQKEANAWGLRDMLGNLWEWCEDRYGEYETGELLVDPLADPASSLWVVRGGSWFSGVRNCRAANRNRFGPSQRFNFLGFRPVLSPIRK